MRGVRAINAAHDLYHITGRQSLEIKLAQLLNLVARIAVGIRLCSAYSSRPDDRNALLDVMWLSDSLHNLNMLGRAIIDNARHPTNADVIGRVCDDLIASYEGYQRNVDVVNSFERRGVSSVLDQGIALFREIKSHNEELCS